MKTLTPVKRSAKTDRERKILLALVDHYILTGKAVGSNTLKETAFNDLSSPTIRNYFARLEEEGYLKQQHSSGGRIPTNLAYKTYAQEYVDTQDTQINVDESIQSQLDQLRKQETQEISRFLQQAGELLSELTHTAVFLSAPRFDHDFILAIKLVDIDHTRCLAIILSNFGSIRTEVLPIDNKLSTFSLKRMEEYFHWRLTGSGKPLSLSPEEEQLAMKFYNELMARYIVNYSHFVEEDVYRTGFSQLLHYPELCDPTLLARSLALFENGQMMRLLLRETQKKEHIKFWIGEDLNHYAENNIDCSVLSIPYYINKKSIGSIALLGPTRIPYKQLFSILHLFSECISEEITKMVYKFKISYRQPQKTVFYLPEEEQKLLTQKQKMLLEDKRN